MQQKNRFQTMNNKLFYEKNYLKNNPSWHSEDSHFKSTAILEIIKKNKIKFKNFCEIGCGAGKVVEIISSKYKKKKFFGYEISKIAFKMCNNRLSNVKYYNKSLESIKKKFDIILCADVLEHVENPYLFLRNIKKKSKYQVFHVPLDLSVNSILRKSVLLSVRKEVGHLHLYTKKLIIDDLKRSNFEIIDYFYTFNLNIYKNGSFFQKLFAVLRNLFYFLNKDLAVNLLGGYSILILTK